MSSTLRTFTAFLALCHSAQAHLRMRSPQPFGNPYLSTAPNNPGPLGTDGTTFPCELGPSGQYDFSQTTTIAAGDSTLVTFLGPWPVSGSDAIATHGGGSCQFALATTPSAKQSDWKVIHTVLGGCPATTAGNLASYVDCSGPGVNETDCLKQYSIQIPKEVPSDKYYFSWTWFNNVGNREMYMQCAPITVTGGGSDAGYLDTLPSIFVANIPGGTCQTLEDKSLPIPNPGLSVEISDNALDVLSDATLGRCSGNYSDPDTALNAPLSGSGGGSIATPATYITTSNPPKGPAASPPIFWVNTALPITPAAGGPAASAPVASNPAPSSYSSAPTAAPVPNAGGAKLGDGAPTATSFITFYTTSANTRPAAAPSSAVPAAPALTPASPAAPIGSMLPANCTGNRINCPYGMADNHIICVSETVFGICDHGCFVPQSVAFGTTCQNGAIG